jgi:hypothetical protein
MQTATQIFNQLRAGDFTETQAKTLTLVLQQAGVAEPGAIGGELEQIESLLDAEPFAPFSIEMAGGRSFSVRSPVVCRFTRHGSIELRQPGEGRSILNTDAIAGLRKLEVAS